MTCCLSLSVRGSIFATGTDLAGAHMQTACNKLGRPKPWNKVTVCLANLQACQSGAAALRALPPPHPAPMARFPRAPLLPPPSASPVGSSGGLGGGARLGPGPCSTRPWTVTSWQCNSSDAIAKPDILPDSIRVNQHSPPCYCALYADG